MSPLRIGLLGGSFNPAHDGHLYISLEALKRLQLDEVWWIVSPQNPLKPTGDMAPFATRFASAQAITAGHRRIKISDFEQVHNLTYTHATLSEIKRRCPQHRFVWLMGADNLASFHRWQHWRSIARLVPIAIFDRSPFSHTALRTKAALSLASSRLPDSLIANLAGHCGKWAYILMRRHPASSTEIRAKSKK